MNFFATRTVVIVCVALVMGCSRIETSPTRTRLLEQASPEALFSHLPTGGRKGLHGMVLFGSGPYFIEHIPMLQEPHDFQMIAQVTILNSEMKHVLGDYSRETHTIKPRALFSLNDLVSGRLKSFKGDLFEGSFERGGKAVAKLRGLTVQIDRYLHIRALPDRPPQENFQVSDRKHKYLLNLVSPERNFQEIRNLTNGWQLWCVKGPDFLNPCDGRPGAARVR
jgi:hypothetical protein